MRTITAFLSLALVFTSTSRRADADTNPGPGTRAVLQVTLGQIIDLLQATIPDAPKSKIPDQKRAKLFVTNLRALLSKADRADDIIKHPMDHALVQGFLKAKKVQWELIFTYFVSVMEEKWPVLSKVNWITSIVTGILTPTDANIGAAFEFCDPRGLKKEVGRRHVLNMLQTWSPEQFAKVLERKGCPSAMLGYLTSK